MRSSCKGSVPDSTTDNIETAGGLALSTGWLPRAADGRKTLQDSRLRHQAALHLESSGLPYVWRTVFQDKGLQEFRWNSRDIVMVNPKLDTRISVRPSSVRPSRSGDPPLDSETGWTGELWSKTNLLNWQN